MSRCINSLIPGGNDVEIIIVNDGSTDQTASMAEEYMALYPGIVRVIHQKNGGHGGAINTGMMNAHGGYIKIVDSDDWVDHDSYMKVLETIKLFTPDRLPDMLLTNFVYEKEGKKRKTIMRYTNVLPRNNIFTWNDVGRFRKGQYILMHSIIYRTDLLRMCGLELPRHTFYVDNLYAYIPLKYVKTLYYLDVDFYRYYIGRPDQSVQENIMIKRIDQQLLVNRLMITSIYIGNIEEKQKRDYLFNYLEIITVASSVLLLRAGTEKHLRKKYELWQFIRQYDKQQYNKLRYGILGQIVNLPYFIGRKVTLLAYRVSQKAVGFN
jgi:glycosyltransferase involved in cell wall biosynthesis